MIWMREKGEGNDLHLWHLIEANDLVTREEDQDTPGVVRRYENVLQYAQGPGHQFGNRSIVRAISVQLFLLDLYVSSLLSLSTDRVSLTLAGVLTLEFSSTIFRLLLHQNRPHLPYFLECLDFPNDLSQPVQL